MGFPPMTEDQQIEHMLARLMYLKFAEHRGKEAAPPPFAPEWCYEYSRIAHEALGHDDDAVAHLEEKYC